MPANAKNNRNRNVQCFVLIVVLGSLLAIILRNTGTFSLGRKDGPRGKLSLSNTLSNNQSSGFQAPLLNTELCWDEMPVPPTKIISHAPGWTVFDKLYVREGTIYVVTDSPELVPDAKEIFSTGQKLLPGNINLPELEPTEKDFKVISTRDARHLFGPCSIRINGVSFFSSESPQYLSHMYHFAAELLFGMWRTYTTLDQGVEVNGHTLLPSPRRWIFPHIGPTQWRDYAAMNQFILRAAFPSMVLEFSDTWEERASLKGRVFTYDQIVLGDRVAAMHGDRYPATERIAAEAFKLRASPSWWNTVRMAVLEFCKVRNRDVMHRVPVITYVSRQKWGRRMLREEDHLRLVADLKALQQRRPVEINVVELDRMPREEQIRVAARTTILMGVHGNGLSTLLWMRPTLQATVIEFFYPENFARDYEWTAQALGIGYYGIWNNHAFSSPNLPPRVVTEDFHGNQIPLDASTVIQLIERRLDRTDRKSVV